MRKKILIIGLVIMIVIALLVNTANAASFFATMTSSKVSVAESTEFTVTVKVSSIDAGSNGINTFSGILSYDTGVFEAITSSSISGLNGWQPTYFPDTGKVLLLKTSFTKNDEDVLQITLKTKANTNGKSGVIALKSVEASTSDAEIRASDISTTITISNAPTAPSEGEQNQGNGGGTTAQPIGQMPGNNSNGNGSSGSGSGNGSGSGSGSGSSGSGSGNTNTPSNINIQTPGTNNTPNTNTPNTNTPNTNTPNTNTPSTINSGNTNTNGGNTNTNGSTNTNTNSNTNSGTGGNIVNGNQTSGSINTVSSNETDIPYTGKSDNIMLAIFVVLVIAGISYFKYESIKDK